VLSVVAESHRMHVLCVYSTVIVQHGSIDGMMPVG